MTAPHLSRSGRVVLLAVHEPGAQEALAACDFNALKVDVVVVSGGLNRHREELAYTMHARGYDRHPRIHGDEVFVQRKARLCGWEPPPSGT